MAPQTSRRTALILITSLFFLWGFLTVWVDSLIPRLRDVFTLTYFQAGLVQFAFFGAYFLLSIPAGFILSRIGYKRGIILGLAIMGLGALLFWPAASFRVFGLFMLAYFTLAGGMTVLQVAANPYVAVLGDAEGASSRLNLAQAFNSLGTAIAPAMGAMFILSDHIKTPDEIASLGDIAREAYYAAEAAAVQQPFVLIALLILALAVGFFFIKLPELMKSDNKHGYLDLLKDRRLMLGAVGIFVYVGAEVAIGSYLVNYFKDLGLAERILNTPAMRQIGNLVLNGNIDSVDAKAVVAAFVTFYWSGAMVGRFIGAYLTRVFAPARILAIFAMGAISLILISMNSAGFVAMWSILGVGLFNSIMFPTIFTLSIDHIGDLKPQASGILCTMIVGGAIVPPLFGLMTDHYGFQTAMALLIICYAFIAYLAGRVFRISL